MRIKTYLLGKTMTVCAIACGLILLAVITACVICISVTDVYDGDKAIIVVPILICGAFMVVLYFLYFKYHGVFIPTYFTDEGVSCKNKLLRWDEVKITVFTSQEPRARYFLLFDREYQYGKKNLIKKRRYGFCVIMDDSYFYYNIPKILEKINSKVMFLNSDGQTETNISDLPVYVKDAFADYIRTYIIGHKYE